MFIAAYSSHLAIYADVEHSGQRYTGVHIYEQLILTDTHAELHMIAGIDFNYFFDWDLHAEIIASITTN